jgi:hypothetical protein
MRNATFEIRELRSSSQFETLSFRISNFEFRISNFAFPLLFASLI